MRRLALLLVIPLLAACGGQPEPDGESAGARAERQAQERQERRERLDKIVEEGKERNRQQAQADYDACVSTWGAFRASLTELNSRLAVGMNVGDYLTAVGDARVEYDKVDVNNMGSQACLDSASRLENAYNAFVKAATTWQECIDDYPCDIDDSDRGREVQKQWAKAGTALTNSQGVLDDMAPSDF